MFMLEIDNGQQWEEHHRYTVGVFNTKELAMSVGKEIIEDEKVGSPYIKDYLIIREVEIDTVINYEVPPVVETE